MNDNNHPSHAGPSPSAKAPTTAPPIERSSMRAVPWFGLVRGLLLALWRTPAARSATLAPAGWQAAGRRRRAALLAIVAALAAAAALLQFEAGSGSL